MHYTLHDAYVEKCHSSSFSDDFQQLMWLGCMCPKNLQNSSWNNNITLHHHYHHHYQQCFVSHFLGEPEMQYLAAY